MKKDLIEVGKIYSNGKTTQRKVLEMGVRVKHYDARWTISDTGVRYLRVKGKYAGEDGVLPLKSFAQWAKEIVE